MSPIPLAAAANAAGFTLSVMASAVKSLYGVAKDLNGYMDAHIAEMKHSDNPTIARTGRVLEGAKHGFGIGFITPIVIIATGQLILGNPLAAISVVATSATLTNPIAMTCAAIGAIYYGWSALTEQEKKEMLDKLSEGLEIGVELIKSMVRIVIDKIKEWFSSDNIKEIKNYIASAAEVFGKTLGSVTHKITDIASDSLMTLKKKTGDTVDGAIILASEASDLVVETSSGAYDSVKETATEASNAVAEATSSIYDSVKQTTEKAKTSVTEMIEKVVPKEK